MSIIYLIRHGQSEANKRRIWGGDFPLTDEGREQALTVPVRISEIPDKVVSSALKRANETARIAYPEADIEVNPAFDEMFFGTQDLKPIADDDYWKMYCHDPERLMPLVGGDDFTERAIKALGEMKKYAETYHVTAIFTSDTILRNIIAHLQGKRPNDMCGLYIRNCGMVRLLYDGEFILDDISEIKPRISPNLIEE